MLRVEDRVPPRGCTRDGGEHAPQEGGRRLRLRLRLRRRETVLAKEGAEAVLLHALRRRGAMVEAARAPDLAAAVPEEAAAELLARGARLVLRSGEPRRLLGSRALLSAQRLLARARSLPVDQPLPARPRWRSHRRIGWRSRRRPHLGRPARLARLAHLAGLRRRRRRPKVEVCEEVRPAAAGAGRADQLAAAAGRKDAAAHLAAAETRQ